MSWLTEPRLTDRERYRQESQRRYLYAILIAVSNASLTLGLLIWEEWRIVLQEELLPVLAFWFIFWALTFGAALVFWRKKNRTRLIMTLFAILAVFSSFACLSVGSQILSMNISLYSLLDIWRAIVSAHMDVYFLNYVFAIIIAQFFTSKSTDPREAF